GLPAEQREAAVRTACEGDERRARRLLELVEFAARGEHTVPEVDEDAIDAPARRREGASIGRYVVTRFLGQGAFGQVYEVDDPELRRRVALKLLREDRATDADLQRFRREAQSLAQIDHPNVVRVYDVGEHDGCRYLTMELIDGTSLRAWLEGPGRGLSWRAVLDTLLPAARGLQAAHAAGIVHRDFKPENVMIERGGRVVVTDFGIARVVSGAREVPLEVTGEVRTGARAAPRMASMGSTASAIGTPYYMAPEQFVGRATPRSDEYAFCRVVVEALSPSPRTVEVARVATLADAVPTLGLDELRAPRWLRSILARGLAVDEAARYPDVAELLRAIESERRWRRWGTWLAVAAMVATPMGYAIAKAPADVCGQWEAAELVRRMGDTWTGLDAGAAASADPEAAAAQVSALRALVEWNVGELATGRTAACEQHANGMIDAPTARARDDCFARWHEDTRHRLQWTLDHPDALLGGRLQEELAEGPARCAHVDAPSIAQPELDAETKVELEARLAEAKDLRIQGDYAGSGEAAEAARGLVDAVGHQGYRAEVLHRLGVLAARQGDSDRAIRLLQEAADAAERSGMDGLGAEVHTSLAETIALAPMLPPREAEAFLVLARAKVARTGGENAELEAQQSAIEGHIAHRSERYAEAEAAYRRAAEQFDALGRPAAHFAASTRANLARAIAAQGRYDEGIAIGEAALVERRAALGDRHPLLARDEFQLGLILEWAAAAAVPERKVTYLESARSHLLAGRALARKQDEEGRLLSAEILAHLTYARLELGLDDEVVAHDIAEFVDAFETAENEKSEPKTALLARRIARRAYDALENWDEARAIGSRIVESSQESVPLRDPDQRQDLLFLISYELNSDHLDLAAEHLRYLEVASPPSADSPIYVSALRTLQDN
ncbi:MAG: protein kinase, partial [Myxococcales bacterium]|nr:protein kinase [Myxococcales bacterium]